MPIAIGLAIAAIGGGLSLAGGLSKGKRPLFEPVGITQGTGEGIVANLQNLPTIEKIAAETNKFNQEQVLRMLRGAIPDYERISRQQGDIVRSQLAGELPEGVKRQLKDASAVYGVTSGTKGSQFAGFRGLRQLGIESLKYTEAGLSNADRYLRTARALTAAPMLDVSRMFISPAQSLEAKIRQQEILFGSKTARWSDPNALQQVGGFMSGMGGMVAGAGMMGGLGGGGAAPAMASGPSPQMMGYASGVSAGYPAYGSTTPAMFSGY
jgi:hypothetical protein